MGYGKTVITSEIYRFVADALLRLKKSESWRGKIRTPGGGWSKEDKEALNLMYFFIFNEILGRDVNVSAVAAKCIYRVLKKSFIWDMKPLNKKYLQEEFEGFDDSIEDYVSSLIPPDFFAFLKKQGELFNEDDRKLYDLAKEVANLIEFEEMKFAIRPGTAETTETEIITELEKSKEKSFIKDILNDSKKNPSVLKALLVNISWSRYTYRWQKYVCNINCSILTHMFETAIFGWLMGYEVANELADKAFLLGLFHDISEIWTDDIPSPAKDGIINKKGKSLRATTEQQELEALDTYFFPCLPEKAREYFKNNMVLDYVKDQDVHDFVKKADYFSADIEVWWNLFAGVRDKIFSGIISKSVELNRTQETTKYLISLKEVIDKLVLF